MKQLFLIIVLVIAVACHEDQDLAPAPAIFTFTIDSKYWEGMFGDAPTTWIMIRDNETGEFLDAAEIVDSEPVEFRTTIRLSGNKIAVSHLQYGPSPIGSQYCNIDIYNGVDVGSSWTLSQKNSSSRFSTGNPVSGEYPLSIDNVPPVYGFSVSNGITGNDFADLRDSRLTGKYSARKKPVRDLVMIDPSGSAKPKYAWIDNVNRNESVHIDYNQFNDFDTYLDIKFPATKQVNARVESLDSSAYFFFYNFHWGRDEIETDELHIGLLNSFPKYFFSLEIDDFTFQSKGAAPQSINVSTDTSNYSYKVSRYSIPMTTGPAGATSYSMSYYSPPGSVEHEPLTPALYDLFKIKMDQMRPTGTNILLAGQTYSDKLRLNFDPEFQRPETYQVSWIGPYFSPF